MRIADVRIFDDYLIGDIVYTKYIDAKGYFYYRAKLQIYILLTLSTLSCLCASDVLQINLSCLALPLKVRSKNVHMKVWR